MKILIISDSHGDTDNIELIAKKEKNLDMVLHCGDGARDFDYIASILHCQVRGVVGNCDFFAGGSSVAEFELEGKKIHMEHGNRLPYHSPSELMGIAKMNGYNLLLYGHTHCQYIQHDGNYSVVNPGSISKPRDGMPSYIILKTDGKGGFDFTCCRI